VGRDEDIDMSYDNDELQSSRGRSRRKADVPVKTTAQKASGRGKQNGGEHGSEVFGLNLPEAAAGESRRSQIDKLRKEQAKKKKTRRRIITMIIAECFALVAIFGYAYFARRLNMMPRPEVDKNYIKNEQLQVEDLEKMKGYWMIALFGVDSRSSNVGAGCQSDVNMIACINQDTGEIKLVSVYRDTYLQTGENRYSKFNEAYAKGGPEQALKYLNRNLDLNITDYATFSWKAVAEAITILGGVDIDISEAEYRYINGFITETVEATGLGSHHLKKTGMQTLDGVQAVAYARLRLMDSDYARTERQKEIIKAAFAKAVKADYSVLNNILVVVLPQVSTNLDFADLTNVALNITKYNIGETSGFPSARGEANMGAKGACVIPQTLESNVSTLHTFLFGDDGYTPTDTVKEISAKIAADSGMYSVGKEAGKVSTDGYLPKETKAPETAAPETSPAETGESLAEVLETDAFGNPIETVEGETIAQYPGIGETDEFGNLIDGPETEDPNLPPGESGSYPYGPGNTTPGGTTPGNRYPGDRNPGENAYGPGVSGTGSGSGRPNQVVDPSERGEGQTGNQNSGGPGAQQPGTPQESIPYPGYVPEESTSAAGPGNEESQSPGASESQPSESEASPSQNTTVIDSRETIEETTTEAVTESVSAGPGM